MAGIRPPLARSSTDKYKEPSPAGASIWRARFLLIALPLMTKCTLPFELMPGSQSREPLSLQNVQLATPPVIAPGFQLITPPAIAPEIELAMIQEQDGLESDDGTPPGLTPEITVTVTLTETLTPTFTATPSASPTTSSTPITVWPTWTTAPTSTNAASPIPSSTNTRAPATQPPPTPTATAADTSEPSNEPPVDPSPTATTAPTNTPMPSNTPAPSGCNPSVNAGYESTLIGLINEARQAQGLHPLSQQSQLTAAARVHSNDMACNEFISHTGSDGSRPADRVAAQGYSYSWIGENILAGSSDPQTAFNWWMNSEPHRNNILHSNYTEIGLGYSYLADSRYRNQYTAVFARPR